MLFVDDDPLILESLALALHDDYDVITAQSRVQALNLLRGMVAPPPWHWWIWGFRLSRTSRMKVINSSVICWPFSRT